MLTKEQTERIIYNRHIRQSFVCAIGGQHDGHLPFWLPGFVEFIMLKLYVFVCIAEINILLLIGLSAL